MLVTERRMQTALRNTQRRARLSFAIILGLGILCYLIQAPKSAVDAAETALMFMGVAGGYWTGVVSVLGMLRKEITPE